MGNLVFGSAERPGNATDAAEIPVVRDNDVAIGQGARPTERLEKATAAARHSTTKRTFKGRLTAAFLGHVGRCIIQCLCMVTESSQLAVKVHVH